MENPLKPSAYSTGFYEYESVCGKAYRKDLPSGDRLYITNAGGDNLPQNDHEEVLVGQYSETGTCHWFYQFRNGTCADQFLKSLDAGIDHHVAWEQANRETQETI